MSPIGLRSVKVIGALVRIVWVKSEGKLDFSGLKSDSVHVFTGLLSFDSFYDSMSAL
jgi:hypothetical protein